MINEIFENLLKEDQEEDILEQLAALEHEQWMKWAKSILAKEDIGEERAKRWEKLFIPYDELSEEMKEEDREYARKMLKILGTTLKAIGK